MWLTEPSPPVSARRIYAMVTRTDCQILRRHPVTSTLTMGGCPDDLVVNCIGPLDWGARQP